MLQRPQAPKLQLTPVQIMALTQLHRLAPTRKGPAPYKGIPSGFELVWMGQFADVRHKRLAGDWRLGTRRTELVTYKSPIMVAIDTRPKHHQPPYNKAREMERRSKSYA